MARNSRYCAPFRRRREGKTDYKARRAFLLSGRPRLVSRSSIENIQAQIVIAKPAGDEVLVSAHSRELEEYGWKAPRGNLPAAYLTGLLCGLKAKAKGIDEAIFDIGLYPPSKGGRLFAVLSGVLDAKVEVPHSEEKLPSEDRLKGEHVAKYAESLVPNNEGYQLKFSRYLHQKIRPEKFPEHIKQVKSAMIADFGTKGEK